MEEEQRALKKNSGIGKIIGAGRYEAKKWKQSTDRYLAQDLQERMGSR